jgi:hypothetical protein
MLQIFTLQLENDKWFLHLSDKSNKDHVLFECQVLYDFVKTNPPIKIYEIINTTDKYEINTLTKKYMEFVGIDNVRGGIYSDEILPDYLIKSLELELDSSIENYTKKTKIFDSIRNKPDLVLDDFIKREISYSELLNAGYQEITREFFSDLEWLKNKIEFPEPKPEKYVNGVTTVNAKDNKKYKKILENMDIVRKRYFELDQDKIKVDFDIIINIPKFTLDYFIYHQHWNRSWDKEKVVALDIIRKYEFMGYTLINIIDGLEFDFYNPN